MTVNAGRKATLVLASNVLGAALGYLTLLVVGRYFAPASYGSFLFALSATGLFAVLTTLGLGTAHQRHVAQGLEPGRGLGVLVRLRFVLGTAVLLLFGLAYLAWAWWRGPAFTDATTPLVLGLVLLMQAVSGARQVLLDTWQGQQRVHRVELLRTLDAALVAAALGNAALLLAHLQGRWELLPGVGAFWAARLGWTAPPSVAQAAVLLTGCYVGAKVTTLVAAWLWSLRDHVRVGPWDRELARAYIRLALPFALMGTLGLVLQYTDSVMLGFFWTAREVGLYGAAQKLSTVCLIGATAVGGVLFPRFAQLHARGDEPGQQATHRRAERYLLLLATPVAVAMMVLPAEGLHVAVGDGYLEAAGPLRILAAWALVSTAAAPIIARLMGAGEVRFLVRATALNAGGNAVLNLLLIPQALFGLGPRGAALATLLATSVTYVALRREAHRRFGLPWTTGPQVRILGAGLLTAAFWLAARSLAGPDAFARAWQLAGWGLAGVAVNAVLLAAVGELHAKDMDFLRKVAHPKALLAELRGR